MTVGPRAPNWFGYFGDLEGAPREFKSYETLGVSFGMVNASSDFGEHPKVINGYELMAEVFGSEKG